MSPDDDATLPAPVAKPADGFGVGAQVAGRYRIVRFIAAGGMGEVYEAEDLVVGTRVALKAVKSSEPPGSQVVRRLIREIALGRKVTHPNVCRLHDVGEHEGRPFLTMELLVGETLAARVKRCGALAFAEVERIATQLVAGLEALHAEGIVHRDFKSPNVIVVGEGETERVVITDFGLARASAVEAATSLTADAGMIGTPAYMAPEQVEGRAATNASDLYALGIVLFEIATGSLPFTGDTVQSMATARLVHDAPRASQRRHDLPARWDDAIAWCLERDPARRPARARDVLALHTRRRRVGPYVLVGAGIVGATAIAIGLAVRDDSTPSTPPACSAASRLAGIWDRAARASVQARFDASELSAVHAAWRRHSRQLDGAFETWARLYDQTCSAPAPADLATSQRFACLEERLHELSALRETLASPAIDPEQFAIATIGEFLFVPASACEVPALLRAQQPLPPASGRVAVGAILLELHRLRAQLRLSFNAGLEVNLDAAFGKLDDLAARARALPYASGARQIEFWHVAMLSWTGRTADADAAAAALVAEAERDHDDAIALQTLALQVQARARSPRPYDEAAADALLAKAAQLAERLDHPPHLEMWLVEARSLHAARMQRYDAFVDARTRLVAIDKQLDLRAHALNDGFTLIDRRAWQGELEAAIAAARASLRDSEALAGGPVAGDLARLSVVFTVAGDVATAYAMQLRAIALYEQAWRERPPTFAWAYLLAAGNAARLGDREATDRHLRAAVRAEKVPELRAYARIARSLREAGARQAAERAVELAAALPGDAADLALLADERRELAAEVDAPATGFADPVRADLARAREQLRRGDAEGASVALAALAARVPDTVAWKDPVRADLDAWLGIALAQRDPTRANQFLERALWIFGSCCMPGPVIAQDARLARARLMWAAGDRDGAHRLAQLAKTALAGMGPALAPKLRAAEAWLASHPID